jgi:hypothetical protein
MGWKSHRKEERKKKKKERQEEKKMKKKSVYLASMLFCMGVEFGFSPSGRNILRVFKLLVRMSGRHTQEATGRK